MASEPACAPVLAGKVDLYGGFIVDASSLPSDPCSFEKVLSSSLKAWREAGYAGIWLKLPIQSAALVPVAVDQGFVFHHAERDYVMLTGWLVTRPCTLPGNASHQVGVGACVLNAHGELLVVKERSGPAAQFNIWKVPTGLLDAGEHFHAGAAREVMEETGLEVEFDRVLALRQAHGFAFGKSDMFIMCGLKIAPGALAGCSDGRPALKPCEREILEAKWMPMAEYLSQDFVKSRPILESLAKCMSLYAKGEYSGFTASILDGGRSGQGVLMHSPQIDDHMPEGWYNN